MAGPILGGGQATNPAATSTTTLTPAQPTANTTARPTDGQSPTAVASMGNWTIYETAEGVYVTNGSVYLGPDELRDNPYHFLSQSIATATLDAHLEAPPQAPTPPNGTQSNETDSESGTETEYPTRTITVEGNWSIYETGEQIYVSNGSQYIDKNATVGEDPSFSNTGDVAIDERRDLTLTAEFYGASGFVGSATLRGAAPRPGRPAVWGVAAEDFNNEEAHDKPACTYVDKILAAVDEGGQIDAVDIYW